MFKLFETKLQKIILALGALIIFFQLYDVSPYDISTALLETLGIVILIVALLVVCKDYYPSRSKLWLLIKRHKMLSIVLLICIIAIYEFFNWYPRYQQWAAQQNFHTSEVAYQNCLDKVASLNQFAPADPASETPYNNNFSMGTLMEINPYFNEWEDSITGGQPDPEQQFNPYDSGNWQWNFMQWMMKKHPDFCSEFNTGMIKSFLSQEVPITMTRAEYQAKYGTPPPIPATP
jgi:hypothetical protein